MPIICAVTRIDSLFKIFRIKGGSLLAYPNTFYFIRRYIGDIYIEECSERESFFIYILSQLCCKMGCVVIVGSLTSLYGNSNCRYVV